MSNGGSGTDVVSRADRAVNEPAKRALSYGQHAAGQKGQPSQALSTTRPATGTVAQARDSWKRLYGHDPILKDVKIHDMSDAPSKYVRAEGRKKSKPRWVAWTNSSTDVYIHESAYDPEMVEAEFWVDSVLMHEAYHVQQFKNGGDKPPDTFELMMEYELNSFSLTRVFLRLWAVAFQPVEDIEYRKGLIGAIDAEADVFGKKWETIQKDYKDDPAKRESAATDFFILNGNMPHEAKTLGTRPFYEKS